MKEIEQKLKNINEAWESYFWHYKFCKSKINFETQGKINYYADIFNYLKDTLPFINNVEYCSDFNTSVFQATGIMQTIYAQQDLMDEILYIFKLQESSQEDKNPNRTIRNELIGHPIRRKPNGGELISSIFLGRYFSSGTINYILYSATNNFVGIDTYHSLNQIIERHKLFLNKYLTLIWNRIKTILIGFKKSLIELKLSIDSNIPLENALTLVEHRFEAIYKSDIIFEKEALLYFLQKQSTHGRYIYSISLFTESLKESLFESIQILTDFIEDDKGKKEKPDIHEPITFTVKITDDKFDCVFDPKNHLSYEFSKLYDKHPIYDIEHFKREFQEIAIAEELHNMEVNSNNNFEYYCSYEYMRKLLIDKGFL